MNGRKIVLILLIIGLTIGVSAAVYYRYSLVSGTVKVEEPVITTYPKDRYTLTMNAASIKTKPITISSTRNTTAYITVLPGDEKTLKEWGKNLVVYPGNDSVKLTAGTTHEEIIFHYASENLPAGGEPPVEYSIRLEVSYKT